MGALDFLRAAIQPTVAARAGYMQGEEEGRQRRRAEAIQGLELQRQRTLDEIKASVDRSTIDRNNAQAGRYDALNTQKPRDAYEVVKDEDGTQYLQNKNDPKDLQPIMFNGKPLKAPSSKVAESTPHTINTSKGIMMWDPVAKKYKATGFEAPARSSSNSSQDAQDRLDAKTALDEAEKNVPRPSKTPEKIVNPDIISAKPGTDIKKLPTMIQNPARAKVEADSTAYEANVLQPLRQHLIDVTVGDKVKIGGKQPSDASAGTATDTPATKTPPAAPAKPKLSQEQNTAMEREFNDASTDLNAVLNSNAPKAVKDQARQLYNQQQTRIAKKYGASSSQP